MKNGQRQYKALSKSKLHCQLEAAQQQHIPQFDSIEELSICIGWLYGTGLSPTTIMTDMGNRKRATDRSTEWVRGLNSEKERKER